MSLFLAAIVAFVIQLVAADGLVTVQANDPSIEYNKCAIVFVFTMPLILTFAVALNPMLLVATYNGHIQKHAAELTTRSVSDSGTSISIVGTTDLYGGVVTITLDGTQSTFNRYSGQPDAYSYDPQCSTTLFQKSGLAPTKHTLMVNHTSDSYGDTSDTGNQFFEWQYLQYYETEDQGQTKPKSNVAAIAGGVGGGVGLILILALLWWWCSKRKQDQEIIFPPMDLAADAPTSGFTEPIVEPFVPPPRPPSQVDPTRRQSRVLQKRSSSSSFKQMSAVGANVATIPYVAGQRQRSPSTSSVPQEQFHAHARRSSIAKGPSADDAEFNPYALGTTARPTSMTDFARLADRPLSGDFSVAGSSFYQQPSSSRGPSSQAPLVPEKGSIGVTNPDAPGPSSVPTSPRLPAEVVDQLPALSDADMARLAAQVATMLQPGTPQPHPRRDGVDEAPPEYSC
ncbi:hypothetical protein FRB90_003437 [Tulasnella sp. 427]|nr:hypothetical protein FRB90_003437 [Tulasnella sp. 427]